MSKKSAQREEGRIEFDDPTYRQQRQLAIDPIAIKYLKYDIGPSRGDLEQAYNAGFNAALNVATTSKPIDMLIFCPSCKTLHIDAPEPEGDCECGHSLDVHILYGDEIPEVPCSANCYCGDFEAAWTNPPHKSHLCHGCGTVFRPADVPTNGVAEINTRGENDTWPEVNNA